MKAEDQNRLIQLLKIYRQETSSREADSLLKAMEKNPAPSKAGRKPKYHEETRHTILILHSQNLSVRRIAAATGCSVGYVHQVLKAHEAQEKDYE